MLFVVLVGLSIFWNVILALEFNNLREREYLLDEANRDYESIGWGKGYATCFEKYNN
jgi:hypothetical protein